MLHVKLIVVGGDARPGEVNLKLPTIIGRAREVSLTLPHPLVSRQHCELFEQDGQLFVRDLQSLNGTYLDNQRIEGTHPVEPNQLLTIGNVTFRAIFQLISAAAEQDKTVRSTGSVTTQSRLVQETMPAEAQVADTDQLENDSIHTRPTTPGRTPLTQPRRAGPTPGSQASGTAAPSSADRAADSVVTAMAEVVPPKPHQSVSASGIAQQLPQADPKVSSISGIEIGDENPPKPMAGQSSLDALRDQQDDKTVSADESALGSFIRKLPK